MNIDACDASVHEEAATALSKTTPCLAQRSRFGDVEREYAFGKFFWPISAV